MKLGRLVPPVAILVVIALAACSGDEGPAAVEPPVESAIGATTTATTEPTGEAALPAVAATVEATIAASSERAAAEPRAIAEIHAISPEEKYPPLEPEPRPGTLPTVEFPDDVALLASIVPGPFVAKDVFPRSLDLVRIYRQNDSIVRGSDPDYVNVIRGELVRETLFSAEDVDQLPESGDYSIGADIDASTLSMALCIEESCYLFGMPAGGFWDLEHDLFPGPIALYESKDGGVTWGQVLPFTMPELEWKPPDSCRVMCQLPLPDGRLLLWGLDRNYNADELIGPEGAAEGRPWFGRDSLHWPSIQDPETGEQWPILLPYEILRSGDLLLPLAVQQGPFLRVTGVDGCLPIRAEASAAAGELACMTERVLLTDLGEALGVDGVTWHRVRTPAGLEGWADGRYLE